MRTPKLLGRAQANGAEATPAERTDQRLGAALRYWLRPWRNAVMIATDVAAWLAAAALAVVARHEFALNAVDWRGVVVLGAFAAVLQVAAGLVTSLYRGRFNVASHLESRCVAGGTFAVMLFLYLTAIPVARLVAVDLPRSAPLMATPVAVVLMVAARSHWRLIHDALERAEPAGRAPTVVVGAGRAGQQIVRAMLSDPTSPYFPVAIVDDSRRLKGRLIDGVSVEGSTADLVTVAQQRQAELVLMAIPSADAATVRAVVDRAEKAGLQVKVLPRLIEIIDGRVGVGDIREATIADLLQRDESELHDESILDFIRGRRVLVTGAGGSIGSELCRQLMQYEPGELHMLDRDESALQAVQLSIDGQGQLSSRKLVLTDMRDADAVERAFERIAPQIVFHAAALKHVPLLELNPCEGIKTNVLGTRNVLRSAVQFGVERFVNISTDKAADPVNVLGQTKRLAERLTAGASSIGGGTFISVRFGNVLGSRGSVLNTFQKQIESGGPITITDPDVTRYFMTVQEAVGLVIQAGAIGSNNEVLVLDMGEPVRIADMARHLITNSGKDVPIIYTGLRPGERLREKLFADEEVRVKRLHPQIWHAGVLEVPLELCDELSVVDDDIARSQLTSVDAEQPVESVSL